MARERQNDAELYWELVRRVKRPSFAVVRGVSAKKPGRVGASRLWDGSLRESGFFFVFGEFHEEGFDEAVEFAVHHGVYIGGLESCAVVFDATVVEHIRTDL